MKYLIIKEDGSFEQTNNEPDEDQLQSIEQGDEQLLQYEGGIFKQAVVELKEIEIENDDPEADVETEEEYRIVAWEAV